MPEPWRSPAGFTDEDYRGAGWLLVWVLCVALVAVVGAIAWLW